MKTPARSRGAAHPIATAVARAMIPSEPPDGESPLNDRGANKSWRSVRRSCCPLHEQAPRGGPATKGVHSRRPPDDAWKEDGAETPPHSTAAGELAKEPSPPAQCEPSARGDPRDRRDLTTAVNDTELPLSDHNRSRPLSHLSVFRGHASRPLQHRQLQEVKRRDQISLAPRAGEHRQRRAGVEPKERADNSGSPQSCRLRNTVSSRRRCG